MGKLFDPPFPRLTIRDGRLEQHEHPAPWAPPLSEDNVWGALALFSFVACASRVCADSEEQCGAVSMTRGARDPQSGHLDGNSYSAIARICVNGPQSLQRYS